MTSDPSPPLPDQYAVSNMARQEEHIFVMEALTMHSSIPDVVAYGFQTLQIIARCVSPACYTFCPVYAIRLSAFAVNCKLFALFYGITYF